MRGVGAQLEPGERVLFETRQHPMAFSGAAGMALCVVLVVFLLIRHNDLPPATEAQIAVVGLLVGLAAALPALLRWRHTTLALTDRRLLVSAGGFRRRELAIPLGPAVLEQEPGLTGKLLDHGTVFMESPDGQLSSVSHVAHARALVEQARAQARRSSRRGAVPG
ncbi:MAG TPA: PH domain-containing protein [Candidatus Binatia bacterium]|nr:PH domain-containing protein [Candidatus Binatia bacterium]